MSLYYITVKESKGEVVYTLDSTTEVSVSMTNRITSHPVASGRTTTDNVRSENDSISFVGYISDVKSLSNSNNKSVEEYVNGLIKVKENATRFKTHFSTKVKPWYPCVIESLEISQEQGNGSVVRGDTSIDSYKIQITIKKIRERRLLKGITIAASEIQDSLESKKTASGMKSQDEKEANALQHRADLVKTQENAATQVKLTLTGG